MSFQIQDTVHQSCILHCYLPGSEIPGKDEVSSKTEYFIQYEENSQMMRVNGMEIMPNVFGSNDVFSAETLAESEAWRLLGEMSIISDEAVCLVITHKPKSG
jgi:hypothetical protein